MEKLTLRSIAIRALNGSLQRVAGARIGCAHCNVEVPISRLQRGFPFTHGKDCFVLKADAFLKQNPQKNRRAAQYA